MKKPRRNYTPKIFWECEECPRGYWILHATAHVPGDITLEVSARQHLPRTYAERAEGLRHYVTIALDDMALSIEYKYNTLVRKHAPASKQARAALDTIIEWQDKQEGE